MDCLQKADRRSLLAEIEDLRAQINGRKMTLEREAETEKTNQGVCMLGSFDPIAENIALQPSGVFLLSTFSLILRT